MLYRAAKAVVGVWCVCCLLAAANPSGIWLDVPFVKQEKDACGAASISMVMQYWAQQQGRPVGESADAVKIQQALFSKKNHGIRAIDLEGYLQEQGFRTFAFTGEWADLKQHLEKGRPLIAVLRPSGKAPLHYVVISGLDWENRVVMINDPAQRKLLKQDQESFEREWSAAGKWTLLAVPQNDAR